MKKESRLIGFELLTNLNHCERKFQIQVLNLNEIKHVPVHSFSISDLERSLI